MKKLLILLVVGILVLSGLGAVALPSKSMISYVQGNDEVSTISYETIYQRHPNVIKYFEYKNDFLKYRAEIIEVTNATITLRENYYYPWGEHFNSYITSYDVNSRRSLNQNSENYYAWIWINEKDLIQSTVYVADKTLILSETTTDFYVFTYTVSPEARGTCYYNKNSLILEKTTDVIVLDGKSVSLTTVLTDSGFYITHDELSEQTEIEDNIMINDESEHQTPFSPFVTYNPPYHSEGGNKYAKAEWSCTAVAQWYANYIIGKHYNYGEVKAWLFVKHPYVPWGRGIAQSWAWVIGSLGGKFSCTQTGAYKVEMSVGLYGASQVSAVWGGWAGAGSASGKNILTGYLYDYGIGYLAGSLTKTLWEGTAAPTAYRTWNNEVITLTFYSYLYSGHQYYFKTQLYAEFKAGFIGILGAGYALTGLDAYLLFVKVTKL